MRWKPEECFLLIPIRLVNFSGSFIRKKKKRKEEKRKACSFAYRFIIWRLAAVPAVPATPAAADVRENRTEKKRNFEEKNQICNSNDMMKTKHDPLFFSVPFSLPPCTHRRPSAIASDMESN